MSNENKSGISEFYFDSLHCSQFFDEHNRKEEKNNLQSYVTVKDTLESIFPICLWNFGQAKARKTWKLPRIVLKIFQTNLVIPRQKRTKPTRLPKYSGGNKDLTSTGGTEE